MWLRAADEDVVATNWLAMPLQQAVHLTFPALRLAHRTAGTPLFSSLADGSRLDERRETRLQCDRALRMRMWSQPTG